MLDYKMMLYVIADAAAAWGAFTDLRNHKIYNKLTVPSLGLGICIHTVYFGVDGLKDSFLGLILGFSCLVFWLLGMLKAGDIKLYMALGALGGWRFCGYTVVYSILAGGAAAFVLMLTRKTGRAAFRRVKLYVVTLLYTKQFRTYHPEDQQGYFSFGCCILAGAFIATWRLCFLTAV